MSERNAVSETNLKFIHELLKRGIILAAGISITTLRPRKVSCILYPPFLNDTFFGSMKAMPSKEELISYPLLLAQRILFSFLLPYYWKHQIFFVMLFCEWYVMSYQFRLFLIIFGIYSSGIHRSRCVIPIRYERETSMDDMESVQDGE